MSLADVVRRRTRRPVLPDRRVVCEPGNRPVSATGPVAATDAHAVATAFGRIATGRVSPWGRAGSHGLLHRPRSGPTPCRSPAAGARIGGLRSRKVRPRGPEATCARRPHRRILPLHEGPMQGLATRFGADRALSHHLQRPPARKPRSTHASARPALAIRAPGRVWCAPSRLRSSVGQSAALIMLRSVVQVHP